MKTLFPMLLLKKPPQLMFSD